MDPAMIAIENVTVLPSPDLPPIERCTVVTSGDRIIALGPGSPTPSGARVIPGAGGVLTAGFWNAHVHFTEPHWRSAGRAPAADLNDHLREMLTRRGFTTVVDAGSNPRSTIPLRRRVESMELLGPSIYTAGPSVFPPKGIPFYLEGSLPFWIKPFVPQPSTPAAAARFAERNLAGGADLIKLFTGSYVERGRVKNMPEPIARAAAEVAHRHGRLVYSHASNLEGTRIAIAAGVDVLAHPPDTTDGVDESLLREMVARRMSMIPTLKMFATTVTQRREYLGPIYAVVRQFHALGGELLFGTDVGYMTDYSTDDEFRALGESGLDARAVLRMLTTAPAERFGVAADRGTVAVGKRADLVLLDTDPFHDLQAFARVRATVRGGRLLYSNG
jgi:imidazolonepropionase-like amidohydrolase